MARFIRALHDLGLSDVPLVGGKNASLGELIRQLGTEGIRVPGGFAITAEGYRHWLRSAGLEAMISETLAKLDSRDLAQLRAAGERIRHALLDSTLPQDLIGEIQTAYDALSTEPVPLRCAVPPPPRTCRTPVLPGSRRHF
jgi:pyruvate,water dikinase